MSLHISLVYVIKKSLKTPLWVARKLQSCYENHIAPFIAKRLTWLLRPAYSFLKKKNYCFIANIAEGIGHILCELDYFARLHHLNKLDPSKKYIWIRKKQEFSVICIKRYSFLFHFTAASSFLYNLSLPFIMAFPDITLDCGLSRIKWQLPPDNRPLQTKNGYLYQISKRENLRKWCEYYDLKNASPDFFPLFQPHNQTLRTKLGIYRGKIALIQLKQEIKNALALPTDPTTYIPTIHYLREKGYDIVFVGRESMPALFRDVGVINYAASAYASFENDLDLFAIADLVICTGSGLSFLAECQNKPYLYINSWQLASPIHSPISVTIPTLLQKKDEENYISFNDQIDLYLSLADPGPELFPSADYIARNATAEEILEGTKELLHLLEVSTQMDHLQMRFRQKCHKGPLAYTQSRISRYFLETHHMLLLDG